MSAKNRSGLAMPAMTKTRSPDGTTTESWFAIMQGGPIVRDTRNAFGATTNALLERIAERFPDVPGMTRRDAVLAVYSSCIGAVMLARAVSSTEARRRILGNTEAMLLRMLALDAPTIDRR